MAFKLHFLLILIVVFNALTPSEDVSVESNEEKQTNKQATPLHALFVNIVGIVENSNKVACAMARIFDFYRKYHFSRQIICCMLHNLFHLYTFSVTKHSTQSNKFNFNENERKMVFSIAGHLHDFANNFCSNVVAGGKRDILDSIKFKPIIIWFIPNLAEMEDEAHVEQTTTITTTTAKVSPFNPLVNVNVNSVGNIIFGCSCKEN